LLDQKHPVLGIFWWLCTARGCTPGNLLHRIASVISSTVLEVVDSADEIAATALNQPAFSAALTSAFNWTYDRSSSKVLASAIMLESTHQQTSLAM
jgi:hypothetical protein